MELSEKDPTVNKTKKPKQIDIKRLFYVFIFVMKQTIEC